MSIRTGLLPLLALLAACGREAPPPPPPRPVLVMTVAADRQESSRSYSGEVRSRTETALSFQVGGRLRERLVDVGARVRAGQVLARLDPVDQSLEQAAAEASLSLATAEAQRYRQLRDQGFVSQNALDSRETSLKAARAQAALARNQRAYTELKSEQDGVIAQIGAEVGQVLAPGQMVFRLARQDQPEVAVFLPESRVGQLRVGDPARISLWADGEVRLEGRVREVSPVADPVTRTYPARISIESGQERVHLGMTATVTLAGGAEGLRLPAGAIFQSGDKPAVWVVQADDSVRLRPVTVLAWEQEGAWVDGGIAVGERLVVAGVHKLAEGERIQPAPYRP